MSTVYTFSIVGIQDAVANHRSILVVAEGIEEANKKAMETAREKYPGQQLSVSPPLNVFAELAKMEDKGIIKWIPRLSSK